MYTAATYDEARSNCTQLGYRLATPKTPQEQAVLENSTSSHFLFLTNVSIWIDLNDRITENTFLWGDGQPVSWEHWGKAQPNNHNNHGQDCVALWYRNQPKWMWNDEQCAA